ncbi:MAG TPA: cation diffusion facilitator family transporter [Bdellovibrionota bacterium]|jgi:cation diffusion facilitator family transporter
MTGPSSNARQLRLAGGLLSLFCGLAIMGLKFYGYKLTNSTALLSDALESVVNVSAAAFALWAIRAAEDPPDEEHPYGHGKIEFVTAVFEGGLISFAAIAIAYEALRALAAGPTAPDLTRGLWIVILAGALNGLLGLVLIRIGRNTHSVALVADGKHVLTDCLTTVGILLGLGVVKATGLSWLDPVIALAMAMLLGYTGVPLVRNAINGLIDAADPGLLEKLLASLERHRNPGIIRVHHVRAMQNGRRIHVDGHLVVPEFWSVEEAHDKVEAFQEAVVKDTFLEGEIEFHIDPCRRVYCRSCDLKPCAVRQEPFEHRPPLNLVEIRSPVDITDRVR